MTVEEYVDESWSKVEEYIYGVQNNTIKTNKWIKLAVDRFKEDVKREDLIYDTSKVDKVFKFFYFLKINRHNRYSRYHLLPFQAFIIAALFGFYLKDQPNKRRYRYALLAMGRKNGKSVFAAALQIYFLMADGVEDPQSLLLASTREQASICLDYATGIINNSPSIRKRLIAQRYKIIFRDKKKGGFSKVLASNASRLDGYSASGVILDEAHAYPDDKLFNVMKSSTLARENPMIFIISTAGFSLTSFYYNYVLFAQNVLSGTIKDDTLFSMIYAIDDDDDYRNPDVWCKANPALEEIGKLSDLMLEFNQAKYSHTQLNNFLTKHLNVFVESESAWIPDEYLKEVFTTIKEEDYYGWDAYLGLDLSATRDLTSLVCLLVKDEEMVVIPYFFMPQNGEKYLRSGGVNLLDWIEENNILQCPHPTIDYDFVIDIIKQVKSKFNIRLLCYDPANSASILNKLYDNDIPNAPFEQKAHRFNAPLKTLEKMVYDKSIKLTNPVLRWNINNAVLYIDGNGNIKIMKNKSSDSVDGAVALGMAMGAFQEINRGSFISEDIFQNK